MTSLEPLSATTRSRPAVEVGDGNADRVRAGEEPLAAIPGWAELAVAQAGINQHVVAAAVGDDQVGGDVVAVEVGHRDRPGGQQALTTRPPESSDPHRNGRSRGRGSGQRR